MEEHIAAQLLAKLEDESYKVPLQLLSRLRANLEDASYAALLTAAADCLSPQLRFVARRLAEAPRCEIDAKFDSRDYGGDESGFCNAVRWFAYGGRWSTPHDPYLLPLAVQAGADVNQIVVCSRLICNRKVEGAENLTCARTPLGVAAELGSIELATRLLDLGASPSPVKFWAQRDYETPLMISLRASDRAMVELLLERGADPNEAGMALVVALGVDLDLARVLLVHGADWRRCRALDVAWLPYRGFEWFVTESGYAPGEPFEEGKSLAEVVSSLLLGAGRSGAECYTRKARLLKKRGADMNACLDA